MNISHSILIQSSPKVVFAWLSSPKRARQWMKSVTKTEILHETAERVGTTFKEVVEEEGGSLEMQGSITRYEQDRLISFHLISNIHELDVDYDVEDMQGAARVTVRSAIHWKFPLNLISLFMGAKMKAGITDQLDKELGELKKLCESGSS